MRWQDKSEPADAAMVGRKRCPQRRTYDLNAAFMSFEQHGCGIHVGPYGGAGVADRTSCARADPQPTVTHAGWQSPRALSVPPPPARSHRLNGLPVQRSVINARCPGRDNGQTASWRSAAQISHMPTLGWPTLILAPQSRRRRQLFIPWRAMINGHAMKLGVKTGYHAHFRLIGVSGPVELKIRQPRLRPAGGRNSTGRCRCQDGCSHVTSL